MRFLQRPPVIASLFLLVCASVLTAGSLRYHGLRGLEARVQMAVASQSLPAERTLPRPVFKSPPSATPPETPPAMPEAHPGALNLAESTPTPMAALQVELPTATATPPRPAAPETVATLPVSIALDGINHAWQTWNNCGPATLAMNLSYYGGAWTQDEIGAALRHSPDDKNVSPEELGEYARAQGFRAIERVDGDADLLRRLISSGIPVFVETWLEEHPGDGMGHYRLMTGYDDARQAWIVYDAFISTNLVAGDGGDGGPYAGIWLDDAAMDALWKVFNRTWMVVYPPEREGEVMGILGARADDASMWAAVEATARAEIASDAGDAFAWFNLGSTLQALGRSEEAAAAFDQARAIGLPWRMLWYQFAPFEAYMAVGRAEDALTLANATLDNTQSIEEIHYWRGRALQSLGDIAGARAAYEQALALYPGYAEAKDAMEKLGALARPVQVAFRN